MVRFAVRRLRRCFGEGNEHLNYICSGVVLGESQSKPEFLGHVATAAVLEEAITGVSTPAVATIACLHFLRVKNEAGFQRYLKRLTPDNHLYHEGGKEQSLLLKFP